MILKDLIKSYFYIKVKQRRLPYCATNAHTPVVPCSSEYKPYFFESFSLEEEASLYDANSSITSSLSDILDMDSICLLEYSVNFDFHTYKDVTLDVSSNYPALNTSGATFVASSMANVNLLYNFVKDSFSVMFDTGLVLPSHLIRMTLLVLLGPF